MKISIDKHILANPIEQATKFISSKNIVPILSEVLIQATPEGLFITGGDGVQFLQTKIADDDYQLIEPGTITMPGKRIAEIVKKMKGVIDIESERLQTKITSKSGDYDLPSLDFEEYPEFINEQPGPTVEIEGETLIRLVEETEYAASTEEATPILMGLRFKFHEDTITVTGTNRHKLSSSVRTIENLQDMQVVVGAKTMKELTKIIEPKERISIRLVDSKLIVNTSKFVFYSRVLEGAYPDVDRLIPNNILSEVKVEREQFLDALEAVWIIAEVDKTKMVRMEVGKMLELKANVSGVGKANRLIDILEIQGESFATAFNCKYVLEAVKSINTNEILITFTGKLSPIVFRGTDDERNYRIVLPYRTEV